MNTVQLSTRTFQTHNKMGLISLITILAIGLPLTSGGECCNGYDDIYGTWHDSQWCEHYCCGISSSALYCCDSSFLQASSSKRSDVCGAWWENNVWAPILTALVCLGIVIGCCVCCYKCCCATNRTTVVMQSPGAPAAMMQSTMVSNQTTVNAGYNQPTSRPSSYPPPPPQY